MVCESSDRKEKEAGAWCITAYDLGSTWLEVLEASLCLPSTVELKRNIATKVLECTSGHKFGAVPGIYW
jgi:hypothetical protein